MRRWHTDVGPIGLATEYRSAVVNQLTGVAPAGGGDEEAAGGEGLGDVEAVALLRGAAARGSVERHAAHHGGLAAGDHEEPVGSIGAATDVGHGGGVGDAAVEGVAPDLDRPAVA